MHRRVREKARHRKALAAGLAASLLIHAAALLLGPFGVGTERSSEVSLTALAEEQLEEDRADGGESSASEPGDIVAPGDPEFRQQESPLALVDAMDEAAAVLGSHASTHLAFPVVPGPALQPVTVESGFTPMFAVAEESGDGDAFETEGIQTIAQRGGGIHIGIGDDDMCVPHGGRIPTIIDRRPGGRF